MEPILSLHHPRQTKGKTATQHSRPHQTHGVSFSSSSIGTASTFESQIRRFFHLRRRPAVLDALSTALQVAVVRTATVPWFAASYASRTAIACCVAVGRITVASLSLLARILTWPVVVPLSYLARRVAWIAPMACRFRRHIVSELFLFMLGPGNDLMLLVFWPGWWVLGCAALGVSLLCG